MFGMQLIRTWKYTMVRQGMKQDKPKRLALVTDIYTRILKIYRGSVLMMASFQCNLVGTATKQSDPSNTRVRLTIDLSHSCLTDDGPACRKWWSMALTTSFIVASVSVLYLAVEPFRSTNEHNCSITKEANFAQAS